MCVDEPSWWGKDIDQNISANDLTLLIFAMGWALCGRPQPEHESVTAWQGRSDGGYIGIYTPKISNRFVHVWDINTFWNCND